MVPRGFLGISILSRCTHKWQCMQWEFSSDVSSSRTIYIAEQRRAAHNNRRTFGKVHQGQKWRRHIGDFPNMRSFSNSLRIEKSYVAAVTVVITGRSNKTA